MKKAELTVIILILLLFSACQAFLGSDPENNPIGIFNQLWGDFNRSYALFDERLGDKTWSEIGDYYSEQIAPDINNWDLFRLCAQMVNTLNDPHVSLRSPFRHSSYYLTDQAGRTGFVREDIQAQLINEGKLAGGEMFLYGRFTSKPTAGYLHIRKFIDNSGIGLNIVQDWAKEIENIVRELRDTTDFLIVDVRNNEGGFSINRLYIASHFVSVPRDYIRVSTKNGPGPNDFSAPLVKSIRPAQVTYTKPIVLLTNTWTTSSAEWFTLALLSQDHVTHAGETTRGSLSARLDRQLVNGWIYSMSIQRVTTADGRQVEGKGISPNREHTIALSSLDHSYGWDTQLRHALNMF